MAADEPVHDRMGSLTYALKYSFSNEESKWGPVLVGFCLMLLSILVIPAFTLFGYCLRIRSEAAFGCADIPRLGDWKEVTREGIIAILVFIPMIAIAGLFTTLGGVIHEGIGILVGLIWWYVAPAVVTVYAVDRDAKRLYTEPRVLEFVTTRTYVIGWFKYALLLVVLYALTVIGAALLFVGLIIVLPLTEYAPHAFWGYIYREAIDREELSPSTEY